MSATTVGAMLLVILGALATPVGQKVVDRLWPETPGGSATAVHTLASTPPVATLAVDPLAVNTLWPQFRGCDSVTDIAVMPGGPAPGAVPLGDDPDPRDELLGAATSAVWTTGHLYLALSVVDDRTVQVVDLQALVFRRISATPAWVYEPSGGCGDVYDRVFALDLDHRTLRDMGQEQPGSIPAAAPEPLGPAFTISASDPALVRIDVTACRGYYEWGVRITYVVAGVRHISDVGTAGDPLRLVASVNAVPLYETAPDLSRLRAHGTAKPSAACH